MARTIAEIKKQMADAYCQDSTVVARYGLVEGKTFDEQFSRVSVESIMFYAVASGMWVVEKLLDTHKVEVNNLLATLRPHNQAWYALKAKAYQHGFDLLADSDLYNNAGKTDAQIAASKIVSHAAVVEQERQLLVKVAKTQADDLVKLSAGELAAFGQYMARIKDAGVYLSVLSDDAEQLKLELTIYYNPLVMNAAGERIDATDYAPVPTVIRNYLKNLNFDGTLVLAHLVDKLQEIDGVMIPHIVSAAYKYGLLNWVPFTVLHSSTSGYMRIADAHLTISYQAHG